jgi:hypothetical protein
MFPIAVLFLVSFVVLVAALAHQAWTGSTRSSWLTKVGVILLGAAVAAALVASANQLFVKSQLEHLADTLGLHRELAWALTLFVSGALSYFLARCVSWRASERRTGFLGVSSLVAAYFLVLYFGTYGDHFDVDGGSRSCVAWDESGVRIYPRQQIDRPTGRPCILVTAENRDELAPILDRRDATPRPKTQGPYFTSRSYADGPVALAWYSRTSTGMIELWDAPGYHPNNGARLRLLTPEVMQEYQHQITMGHGPERPADAPAPEPRTSKEATAPVPASNDPERALRGRYLHTPMDGTPRAAARPRWTLVAWSDDGRFDPHASDQVADAGRAAGLPPPASLFAEPFVQDGSADRVLRGDAGVLKQMGLSGTVDFVVLARGEARRLPDRGQGTFRAVDYSFQLQVLRVADLARSPLVGVTEGGAGYDYEIAAERARQAAFERLAPELTTALKGFVK